LAVAVGALSLAWYLMKRKLKSTNPKVRKLAKYFFNWHTWAGWIAFAIILAHGVYFVLTEFGEDDTITGIIAFAFMVSLIIVGLFLQAKRSKTKRMTHFVLAIVWCVATVIHAEDAIPLLLVVLGGSFALVWLLEKRGNEGG
jgi:Na+/melibiose symporter-like transporter